MNAIFTDPKEGSLFFMRIVAAYYAPDEKEVFFEGDHDFLVTISVDSPEEANAIIEGTLLTNVMDLRTYDALIIRCLPSPYHGDIAEYERQVQKEHVQQ